MSKVTTTIMRHILARGPVFSTSDVANATGITLPNASRDLSRLCKRGMIQRVRRGLWAVSGQPDFSPFAVVPHLFEEGEEGYVSLLSALNLHGMIEQIPRVIHVVSRSQRAALETAVGTYEFHQLQADLFCGYEPYRGSGNFDIATPEKAIFDTVYFSVRKGRRFSALPELELPRHFDFDELMRFIEMIDHQPLRRAVYERWLKIEERSAEHAA